jgi:hypothetical protein
MAIDASTAGATSEEVGSLVESLAGKIAGALTGGILGAKIGTTLGAAIGTRKIVEKSSITALQNGKLEQ